MQISSDTIKDIDVPASGSVMITFTKFKPKRGYNRVVLAHSFNNSSNGGSNYSGRLYQLICLSCKDKLLFHDSLSFILS